MSKSASNVCVMLIVTELSVVPADNPVTFNGNKCAGPQLLSGIAPPVPLYVWENMVTEPKQHSNSIIPLKNL
jgi:hypothetical protein